MPRGGRRKVGVKVASERLSQLFLEVGGRYIGGEYADSTLGGVASASSLAGKAAYLDFAWWLWKEDVDVGKPRSPYFPDTGKLSAYYKQTDRDECVAVFMHFCESVPAHHTVARALKGENISSGFVRTLTRYFEARLDRAVSFDSLKQMAPCTDFTEKSPVNSDSNSSSPDEEYEVGTKENNFTSESSWREDWHSIHHALRDMGMSPPDSISEPSMASGVAGKSRVWFISYGQGGRGELNLIAKLDEPGRAEKEWDAIESLRTSNLPNAAVLPMVGNIRAHGVVIYQNTAAQTSSGQILSLLDLLKRQLKTNSENCIKALGLVLNELSLFFRMEPGSANLADAGGALNWGGSFPSLNESCLADLKDKCHMLLPLELNLPDPIAGAKFWLSEDRGRTLYSRIHGDANLTNFLIGVDGSYGPDKVFIIDLASSGWGLPAVMDLARIEAEFWHEVYTSLVGQDGRLHRFSLLRGLLDRGDMDPVVELDDASRNAYCWVRHLRLSAYEILKCGLRDYAMVDYMVALYLTHLRSLKFQTVNADENKIRIALVGAASALGYLEGLNSGVKLKLPVGVKWPQDRATAGPEIPDGPNESVVDEKSLHFPGNDDLQAEFERKLRDEMLKELKENRELRDFFDDFLVWPSEKSAMSRTFDLRAAVDAWWAMNNAGERLAQFYSTVFDKKLGLAELAPARWQPLEDGLSRLLVILAVSAVSQEWVAKFKEKAGESRYWELPLGSVLSLELILASFEGVDNIIQQRFEMRPDGGRMPKGKYSIPVRNVSENGHRSAKHKVIEMGRTIYEYFYGCRSPDQFGIFDCRELAQVLLSKDKIRRCICFSDTYEAPHALQDSEIQRIFFDYFRDVGLVRFCYEDEQKVSILLVDEPFLSAKIKLIVDALVSIKKMVTKE